MCVTNLLSKLDKVKKTAPDQWIACCPAHDDKHPSLSVRETEDGTVLIKCWAGCGAVDVLSAVELEFSDLFPNKGWRKNGKRERQPFNQKDILRIMSREAFVVVLAASDLIEGKELSVEDMQRLQDASRRLSEAAEMAVGNY